MYQTSQSGKLVFEIIAVTNLKFQDGCSPPNGAKFKFTRLDSKVTAAWISKQLSCTTDCGADDYKTAYLSTHSTFIKGNPIFIKSDQAIDSSSLQTRLLMQRDGNLVAYCKKDGRVAWASGTNAPNGRILTIGVWKDPTPTIIFSPIRRNAQYFRNQGTGIDFVNDYLYRSQRWPTERLSEEDLAGFGSFPIPNNNPEGSAILSVLDDGLEMAWTTDTVSPSDSGKTVLGKISWPSCVDGSNSGGNGTTCKSVDVRAGQIFRQYEAEKQCPGVCLVRNGTWNRNWTRKNGFSVCGCRICQ
jgi:hypothetical protein